MDPIKPFFVHGMLPEPIKKLYTQKKKTVLDLENIVRIPTSSTTQNKSLEKRKIMQSYPIWYLFQLLHPFSRWWSLYLSHFHPGRDPGIFITGESGILY